MGIIQKNGFCYGFDPLACKECSGRCCCGDTGYIWVNHKEIHEISNFLKINIIDFKNKYLIKIDSRFSIKERFINNNFECIFFDNYKKNCTIYEVRPLQCIEFPFWNSYKKNPDNVFKECQGVGYLIKFF